MVVVVGSSKQKSPPSTSAVPRKATPVTFACMAFIASGPARISLAK
jgi:hypothetical protein